VNEPSPSVSVSNHRFSVFTLSLDVA
jgi:hypothetical protein